MIVAIADDFTGAAEIAGIGLRYGLKVDIETKVISNSEADLLVIATDTRSLTVSEAQKELQQICSSLNKLKYEWIFKKTDSVLRGHIYDEILTLSKSLNIKKSLLVPANPLLGRTIKDGVYFINGRPLHESKFSNDPEYCLTNSNVKDILGNKPHISILKPNQNIKKDGFFIGESQTIEDINIWAGKIKKDILPAGAANFFSTLLEIIGYKKQHRNNERPLEVGERKIFVCGSAYSRINDNTLKIIKKRSEVLPMPENIFNNPVSDNREALVWKDNIIGSLIINKTVVMEIDQPIIRNKKFSKKLRDIISQVVNSIFEEITVDELLISGGATVYSIVENMEINKISPVEELAPGVIRSKVSDKYDFYLTIKPGSYKWPESLLARATKPINLYKI